MNSILVYQNIRLGQHFFETPRVFQSFEGLLVHHKLLRNLVRYWNSRGINPPRISAAILPVILPAS